MSLSRQNDFSFFPVFFFSILFSVSSCLFADDPPSAVIHQTGEFGRFFRGYNVPEGTLFSVVKAEPFQIKELLEKNMLRMAITPDPPAGSPKWNVTKLAMSAPILAVHPSNPLRDICSTDAIALLHQKLGSWRTLGGSLTRIHLYKKADATLPLPVIRTCACHANSHDHDPHNGEKPKGKNHIVSFAKPLLLPTETDNKTFSLLFTDPAGLACFDITRYDEKRVPLLTIDKIPPTLKEFESGRYPLLTAYYLVEPVNPSPEEKRLARYILSRDFAQQLYQAGFLPAHVVSAPKQTSPASPMRPPVPARPSAPTPSAPGANLPAVKPPPASPSL